MQKPASIIIESNTRFSYKRKYQRFYVLLSFDEVVSETEMDKVLTVLEATSLVAKKYKSGGIHKIRVKSFCILPDNKRVLVSIARASDERYYKYILKRQINQAFLNC